MVERECRGRILLADDEESFARRTAELLNRAGYECEWVQEGLMAVDRLSRERYDLLIADINMPGNEGLELVREGPLEGVPVLLVTGAPSLETAIESVGLPVAGYLVKPFRFEALTREIDKALELSHLCGTLTRARERLERWSREIGTSGRLARRTDAFSPVTMDAYVESTVRNVTEALMDMARITAGHCEREAEGVDVCRFFDCPRLHQYRVAVEETIDVLEKTKRAFRSKELGQLRQKLEALMKSEEL